MGLPGRPRYTDSTMHWLPVTYRIRYKLALQMYLVFSNRCPRYISDSVSIVDYASSRVRLRLSSRFSVPRTGTKLVDRAFSVAGHVIWSSLL